MSYTTQYIDSLRFLGQIEPESTPPEDYLLRLVETLKEIDDDPILVDAYRQGLELLEGLAVLWLEAMPYDPQHKCHSLAQGFLETWASTPYGDITPLAITIGNVYYQGQSIYDVTRESIVEAIRIGPTTAKLPMHVWLTRDDMTVIDFAIKPSLVAMGMMPASQPDTTDSQILVWSEKDPGDFIFEPLLVHNNFFYLVDNGESIQMV